MKQLNINAEAALLNGSQIATLDDLDARGNNAYEQIQEDSTNKTLSFSADKYILLPFNSTNTERIEISNEELILQNCEYLYTKGQGLKNITLDKPAPVSGWYVFSAFYNDECFSFTMKIEPGQRSSSQIFHTVDYVGEAQTPNAEFLKFEWYNNTLIFCYWDASDSGEYPHSAEAQEAHAKYLKSL